jgi:hypothetical protein
MTPSCLAKKFFFSEGLKTVFPPDWRHNLSPVVLRSRATCHVKRRPLELSDQGCQRYFFKPKIPILISFGRPCNGKSWYLLSPFGIFYEKLVYSVIILNTCGLFGIFFPVSVGCDKKNLATLWQTTTIKASRCFRMTKVCFSKQVSYAGRNCPAQACTFVPR